MVGDIMEIYFNLTNGYLDGWSSSSGGNDHHTEVSDDHEVLRNPEIFKFEDGELIKDEERQKELKEENEKDKISKQDLNENAIKELARMVANMEGGE